MEDGDVFEEDLVFVGGWLPLTFATKPLRHEDTRREVVGFDYSNARKLITETLNFFVTPSCLRAFVAIRTV